MEAIRKVLQEGDDYDLPTDGAECLIEVIEDVDCFFPEKETVLTLGDASTDERLALEQAIMRMRPGEVDEIRIGNKTTTFKLVAFNSGLKVFEMSTTEKWRLANWHKDSGVALFKDGKVDWAFRRFSLALKYIISLAHDVPASEHDDEDMNINRLRMLVYLNLCACQLKVESFEFAVVNATKAIEIDSKNVKALFRRGTGLMHLQEYERSLGDLKLALELEPGNPQILLGLQELKSRMGSLDAKVAAAMKKMFQ